MEADVGVTSLSVVATPEGAGAAAAGAADAGWASATLTREPRPVTPTVAATDTVRARRDRWRREVCSPATRSAQAFAKARSVRANHLETVTNGVSNEPARHASMNGTRVQRS